MPWHALNSEHAQLALCAPQARKYPADVAPFAGIADNSRASVEQLLSLIEPGESVFVVSEELLPLSEAEVDERFPALQMLAGESASKQADPSAVRMSAAEAEEMVALTNLAYPGFFRRRTYLMGVYYGIRVDGQLVAMAGERMAVPGWREISGVCTHPDHTGKGYAARLLSHLLAEHAQAGLQSLLHVSPDNSRAIALYTRLGFKARREISLYPLSRRK